MPNMAIEHSRAVADERHAVIERRRDVDAVKWEVICVENLEIVRACVHQRA